MMLSGPNGAAEAESIIGGRQTWNEEGVGALRKEAVYRPSHFVSSRVEEWRLRQWEPTSVRGSAASRVDGTGQRPSTYASRLVGPLQPVATAPVATVPAPIATVVRGPVPVATVPAPLAFEARPSSATVEARLKTQQKHTNNEQQHGQR